MSLVYYRLPKEYKPAWYKGDKKIVLKGRFNTIQEQIKTKPSFKGHYLVHASGSFTSYWDGKNWRDDYETKLWK